MWKKLSRLCAFLLTLTLMLAACAGAPADASRSSGAFSDGGPDLPAVPVYVPEPEPEPEPPEPQPVLTQQDVDDTLAQVMERYKAAGVTVATVELGRPSRPKRFF